MAAALHVTSRELMKVKQKISGGFRCLDAATDFADIRSFISTAKKQGWNVIQAIAQDPQICPRNSHFARKHSILGSHDKIKILVRRNFIVGRCTASAMASASRKSFFCPFDKGAS
jgi:hypothetical protein